jgi:hypothetical protein
MLRYDCDDIFYPWESLWGRVAAIPLFSVNPISTRILLSPSLSGFLDLPKALKTLRLKSNLKFSHQDKFNQVLNQ